MRVPFFNRPPLAFDLPARFLRGLFGFLPLSLSSLAVASQGAADDGVLHRLFTLPGQSPGERQGAALVELGDLDGDGASDFAIGAPAAPFTGPAAEPAGCVRIHSGASGLVLHQLHASTPFERFGSALARVPDVDGDGIDELAIGAPLWNQARGRVELRSGLDGSLLWQRAGDAGGDRLGASLAGLADLDGDGRGELLVGSPGASLNAVGAGAALVLSGASGQAWLRFDGQGAFDQLGARVAAGLDADGDGFEDLLIGVPFADGAGFNAGRAELRSGRTGLLLASAQGLAPGDQLGFDLGPCPDRSGDGLPDFWALGPASDLAGLDSGGAWVFGGLDGALLLALPGPGPGLFTSSATALDDLDGDGWSEFALGTPAWGAQERGLVRLLRGSDGTVLAEFMGDGPWDWFGAGLTTLEDLSGDGFRELLIGAPGHDDHFPPGFARVLSPTPLDLSSDQHLVHIATGGTVGFEIHFGAPAAGALYVLLVSASGSSPGADLDGIHLALNPDAWTGYQLMHLSGGPWSQGVGLLDGSGRASASLVVPSVLPGLIGLEFRHAAVRFCGPDPAGASRAAPLSLLP